MIPSNIKSKDLVGQYVLTEKTIMNGAGIVIPKGTKVKIAHMGRSFTIETEPCACCGLHAYVRGVTRKEVRLLD